MSDPKPLGETHAKLREMANLAIFSNKITEFHEKNMKMYPLVYFNGVSSVKIDYDLSHTKTVGDVPVSSQSMVSYYLEIDETQDNSHLDNRFIALEKSVRTLFWKDVVVEVFFNNRIVYKSKK